MKLTIELTEVSDGDTSWWDWSLSTNDVVVNGGTQPDKYDAAMSATDEATNLLMDNP
jgi:hypothetical protein